MTASVFYKLKALTAFCDIDMFWGIGETVDSNGVKRRP